MTTTATPNKTTQRELDAHAKLREQFSAAYADVETSDEPLESAAATKLRQRRDAIGAKLTVAADKLRKRGYELRNDDSAPKPPAEPTAEKTAADKLADNDTDGTRTGKPGKPAKPAKRKPAKSSTPKPTVEAFTWSKPAQEVLVDYLRAEVTADADAPNRSKPFISPNGLLRLHSTDWRTWLEANGYAGVPKGEAAKVLRDAGMGPKAFALPGEERSLGFYTVKLEGKLAKALKDAPRRVIERAAGKARNPFAKLTDNQRGVLKSALADYKPATPEAIEAQAELTALLAAE